MRTKLNDFLERLPQCFNMVELEVRAKDKTPFVVVALQEVRGVHLGEVGLLERQPAPPPPLPRGPNWCCCGQATLTPLEPSLACAGHAHERAAV